MKTKSIRIDEQQQPNNIKHTHRESKDKNHTNRIENDDDDDH